MTERPRFNSEYVQSFVFGIKLLSLLCLLAAPVFLFFLSINHGSQLLQKLPFLSQSGLSIVSAQSFPYDPNDPLLMANTRQELAVRAAHDKQFQQLSPDRQRAVLDEAVRGSAIRSDRRQSIYALKVTSYAGSPPLAYTVTYTKEQEARLLELLRKEKAATQEPDRKELARRELARRELARRLTGSSPASAQPVAPEPDFASAVPVDLYVNLYVKTNRATTNYEEYNQLKERAEQILNDDRVIRVYFSPDNVSEPHVVKARTPEELASQLAADPDFRGLPQHEQDAVYAELAKDIDPSFDIKTARPVPFELRGIPDYMKTVIPSETTSLGGFVNVVGFIGVTVFCLALYFPLAKSIVDLFKRRRAAKR